MALEQNRQNFTKDPNAVLDYTVDWSSWLQEGEAIQSSSWVVDAGITDSNPTNTGIAATIWLSGGIVNKVYRVTNRITTSAARVDDRSLLIAVRQK